MANLILAAHAMGAIPTNFGGTNLVQRLLATEQTSGPDAGLFGTDAQNADFNAGTFDQGLALAALSRCGHALRCRGHRRGSRASSVQTAAGLIPTP